MNAGDGAKVREVVIFPNRTIHVDNRMLSAADSKTFLDSHGIYDIQLGTDFTFCKGDIQFVVFADPDLRSFDKIAGKLTRPTAKDAAMLLCSRATKFNADILDIDIDKPSHH